ncbi:hypothetical protein Axi01nite_25750 [Actinoplanes xinjiangensis]|nr:hypothetical protein Axi01nite_25750 [Actinoplanes xinjiangensis]
MLAPVGLLIALLPRRISRGGERRGAGGWRRRAGRVAVVVTALMTGGADAGEWPYRPVWTR